MFNEYFLFRRGLRNKYSGSAGVNSAFVRECYADIVLSSLRALCLILTAVVLQIEPYRSFLYRALIHCRWNYVIILQFKFWGCVIDRNIVYIRFKIIRSPVTQSIRRLVGPNHCVTLICHIDYVIACEHWHSLNIAICIYRMTFFRSALSNR
jgi:hypothetical protein